MMAVALASTGLFLTGFTEASFRRIHSFTWFDYCVLVPRRAATAPQGRAG